MSESSTTLNGHEIKNPKPIPEAVEFKQHMAETFGFEGGTPLERSDHLRDLSVEGVAILLEDINKQVQGAGDSLMSHDDVVRIGGKETVRPENRYDVFLRLIEDIKSCPSDTNPARIGDVLALGVLMLHPFHDGNGRTSRVLGLMFRDDYDSSDYAESYAVVTEGRDKARATGGRLIMGYVPYLAEGTDQSDPEVVSTYLHNLLNEPESLYTGTYGATELKTQS